MKPARKPGYLISGLGMSISPALDARLQRLRLVDKRAMDADQLEFTLEDHDGRLAIPRKGARLGLSLGFQDQGLIDRGTYIVDEVEHAGAPDTLTIRARSADLRIDNPAKRCGSWQKKYLGMIVGDLAGRLDLSPRIGGALAGIFIEHLDQTDESDMHLLTRLAERFDATCTPKNGQLLFLPKGTGKTAGGTRIPGLTLRRDVGDRHRYIASDRESWTGVIAYWSSLETAERQRVVIGDTGNAKRLRPTYENADHATEEATAEWQRIQRGLAEMSLVLAEGRADLYPETPVTLRDFKAEIDATPWLITEVVHDMSDTGYTTTLSLEIDTG
ncbi:contractile injection system protein, VgrG/Pvc8 family [Modicisalibacter sp. MOD 31.J]|uniref:contractile injection system protein, VgrG/Pvc8 family n=1 Tax=Modicisalibacter sp. MOD 31.J TaxID=2831897 RepID=UPI001CCFDC4E|nr:contractile injection system protein, VgrG/Pvc8 family [Modicisalibacter sp. MOD 31.J]MBZ9576739.1 phage late control D family protein [Modicisalibacter sp. MOD 31.J]